jgi:dipeptidyl aminopeptidase/acylaminoacyl peptidase
VSKQVLPYGSWPSPVSVDMLAAKGASLSDVRLMSDNQLYWLQSPPEEGGRYVVMRQAGPGAGIEAVTPPGFNVRTRVHEYGGAPFAVDQDTVYFSNFDDNRIYRQPLGSQPVPLTDDGAMRYADLVVDSRRRALVAVREDHTHSDIHAVTAIVQIPLSNPTREQVLIQGADFYMAPRISPDGRHMAWICWNHPNMPWDGTELWVADLTEDGGLGPAQRVAGGVDEAIYQPAWSPGNTLYFVSDRTGWWNIYRWSGSQVTAVTSREAEFGEPYWVFGLSSYGFFGTNIVAVATDNDVDHLLVIDAKSTDIREMDTPYNSYSYVNANEWGAAFLAGSGRRSTALVRLTADDTLVEVQGEDPPIGLEDISVPEALVYPTTDGQTAHLWYYAPANARVVGPADEKPPLIVFNHGGPTSRSTGVFRVAVQYWTSRGFAVVDVNYRGSSGYGRAYRRLLNQSWGIVDVEDCCNAALYMAGRGLADPERMAIRGGSAGGYTTLACLTFRDVFSAGASHFGVSDLSLLARETHKFESRYLDSMIGPWPETKERYDARSPLMHMAQVKRPLIFFQGLDDKVVLPNQAELMVEDLKSRGVPVAYLAYPGEGHGFRRAENIIKTAQAELSFYAQVFGIELAEAIDPVHIFNWPPALGH